MTKKTPRSYKFYESDPTLCEILDELVRDRQLTPTIHNLLMDGLGKDIKKTKKELKKRISKINRVDRLYKKLQKQKEVQEEKEYGRYTTYRKGLEKNEIPYNHDQGLKWIEKEAENIGKDKEKLLFEFEERYSTEATT